MMFKNEELNLEYVMNQETGLMQPAHDYKVQVYSDLTKPDIFGSGKRFFNIGGYNDFMEYKHHVVGVCLISKFGEQPKDISDAIIDAGNQFDMRDIGRYIRQ